ncbi:hypothetical protein EVU91_02295 [Macrococcoides bohemicum]|uniref:hypothetical protein n=1 Tax=Macrococcoides bohemicum TaxID=1903056 RepID=UPI0010596C47|nr:hypothetical protein [Macrococcus bohemicus]TDL40744.1 hypothetical protein EVU91_02295 [Macrococcus bohemicus]
MTTGKLTQEKLDMMNKQNDMISNKRNTNKQQTLMDEAKANMKYMNKNKDKINKQSDDIINAIKSTPAKTTDTKPTDKPNRKAIAERNKKLIEELNTTISKGDNTMTNTLNEYELYINGNLTNREFKDFQQVRTVSMQDQYANNNGIGRTANRMIQANKELVTLTSHDSSLIKPSFSKPLLLTQDAPQSLREVIHVTDLDNINSTVLLDYVSREVAEAEYEGLTEVDLKAHEIDFKYHGERLIAEVSDTIVFSNDVGYLDETIKTTLKNALIDKEMQLITGEAIVTEHGHDNSYMNLYRTVNPIKQVTGTTVLESITNAVNDLHRSVQALSTLAINNEDYIKLMKELGSIGLGSIDLKAYFGITNIIVNSYIKAPVVGNFKCLHANYKFNQFEFYKNKPKSGICSFVLSYIYDMNFIPMAFRIAKVG